MQGADDKVVEALARGELVPASISGAEHALLEWVGLLTRQPACNSPAEIDRLRAAGWQDDQIAEAAYIAALFAFFNRVADAFGLEEWRP